MEHDAKEPLGDVKSPVASSSDAPVPFSHRVSKLTWITVLVSLLFAEFLFALDNVIVADIQPVIIEALGEIDRLPWVGVGYAVGGASLTLPVSRLFASFNHKYIFITGVVVFEIGSTICGAAPNMTALIFGRVICGPGAVMMYMGLNNLLVIMTTEAERPMYMGLVGISFGSGSILGPVIGGAFSDGPATWRWSFYINLCLGGVLAPIYIFMLPSHRPRPETPFWDRVREIDWTGWILNVGAYISLVMAISFGGSVYAWSSGQIIALFVVSGVLWIALVLQQRFTILTTRANRMICVEIVTDWEMIIFFAEIASAMTVCFVPLYFIPIYLQFTQGADALGAAAHVVPFSVFNIIAVVVNGIVLAKVGYYWPWYLAGGSFAIIGGSLFFVTLDINTSSAAIYGYSILLGLGAGLFTQTGLIVAQAKVSLEMIPHALAFMGCGQITGITFALGISQSVFLNIATERISAILPDVPRASIQQTIQGVNSSLLKTLDDATRQRVLVAIVDSISRIYAMVIAAGALAVVLALIMKKERLFKQQEAIPAETVTTVPRSKGQESQEPLARADTGEPVEAKV